MSDRNSSIQPQIRESLQELANATAQKPNNTTSWTPAEAPASSHEDTAWKPEEVFTQERADDLKALGITETVMWGPNNAKPFAVFYDFDKTLTTGTLWLDSIVGHCAKSLESAECLESAAKEAGKQAAQGKGPVQLTPGLKDHLHRLKKKGVKLFIISYGFKAAMTAYLKEAGCFYVNNAFETPLWDGIYGSFEGSGGVIPFPESIHQDDIDVKDFQYGKPWDEKHGRLAEVIWRWLGWLPGTAVVGQLQPAGWATGADMGIDGFFAGWGAARFGPAWLNNVRALTINTRWGGVNANRYGLTNLQIPIVTSMMLFMLLDLGGAWNWLIVPNVALNVALWASGLPHISLGNHAGDLPLAAGVGVGVAPGGGLLNPAGLTAGHIKYSGQVFGVGALLGWSIWDSPTLGALWSTVLGMAIPSAVGLARNTHRDWEGLSRGRRVRGVLAIPTVLGALMLNSGWFAWTMTVPKLFGGDNKGQRILNLMTHENVDTAILTDDQKVNLDQATSPWMNREFAKAGKHLEPVLAGVQPHPKGLTPENFAKIEAYVDANRAAMQSIATTVATTDRPPIATGADYSTAQNAPVLSI